MLIYDCLKVYGAFVLHDTLKSRGEICLSKALQSCLNFFEAIVVKIEKNVPNQISCLIFHEVIEVKKKPENEKPCQTGVISVGISSDS